MGNKKINHRHRHRQIRRNNFKISTQNIMYGIKWIFLSVFFFNSTILYCQLLKRHKNQYDENGQRKGLWITYWDEEEKIPMSVARFNNGHETGVSKEYHQNGNLRLKFRYYRNRIRVKYYDENRKLEQKGWSVIEYNADDTHYYWHGKWKFFTENRKLIRISHYLNGKEITSE